METLSKCCWSSGQWELSLREGGSHGIFRVCGEVLLAHEQSWLLASMMLEVGSRTC